MKHKGNCLCGAVAFEITKLLHHSGACHCANCRQWSGGIYLSVEVRDPEIVFKDTEQVGVFTSSDWAERAFCKTCGSSLWYRVTAPGPLYGVRSLALGAIKNPDGIKLGEELYIDRKPDGYSFSEDTKKITTAELEAMFAQA